MCNLYDKTNHAIHIILEAGNRAWTDIRQSTQGNWVQSRSLIEFLHMYDHRTKNKGQK